MEMRVDRSCIVLGRETNRVERQREEKRERERKRDREEKRRERERQIKW